VDPLTVGSATFELRDPTNAPVAATVTYDAVTRAAALTPAARLAPSATYTATIKGHPHEPHVATPTGEALASDVTWSFTTAGCPCTIWSGTTVPAIPADPDTNPVEVGVRFSSDTDGLVTGLRFYKGPGNTGPHVGHLWTGTGTLLAAVTFGGETASGWQEAPLASPVPITKNTTYIASYHAPAGRYAADPAYFAPSDVYTPPLRAPRSTAGDGNGVFRYGASGFPSQSHNGNNYWVDVVFVGASTPP
jgi:hypothetical protein